MNWPTSASRLASVSLFAVSLLGLATGCEKANDLGLELPGTAPITANYLDLPVTASTVRQQPVETVKANHILVGRLRDSFVGTTTANGFLNLLTASGDTLPSKFTATTLDSVVLSMPFDVVYGTATQPLRLNLYNLQQPLNERAIYNSASSVPTGAQLLSDFEVPLNRNVITKRRVSSGVSSDTTTTVITTSAPDRTMRVRLQKYPTTAALATSVFTALASPGFDQSKLDAIWKGLALQPTANHASNVVGFTTNSAGSISFYYQGTAADGKIRKRLYRLALANSFASTPGKYFTQLSTDLSGTALAGLTTPQTTLPAGATNNLTYTQEGTGLATRIEFQQLDNLRNNPDLIVNRAELLVPVKSYSNGLFPYPSGLYLYEVNSSNQVLTRTVGATTFERLVPREGINAASTARLTPTAAVVDAADLATARLAANQEYYTVPVTEYLQAYLQNRLDGEIPSGLLLSPVFRYNFGLGLSRAQLDANNIKLRVYYSKLR